MDERETIRKGRPDSFTGRRRLDTHAPTGGAGATERTTAGELQSQEPLTFTWKTAGLSRNAASFRGVSSRIPFDRSVPATGRGDQDKPLRHEPPRQAVRPCRRRPLAAPTPDPIDGRRVC